MSVFSLDTRADNPVTLKDVDEICSSLGVSIQDNEKESYRTLLAVYHESVESLMAIPGIYSPSHHHSSPSISTDDHSQISLPRLTWTGSRVRMYISPNQKTIL